MDNAITKNHGSPDSDANPRLIGHEWLLQDQRSTADLVETALTDTDREDNLPENYHAIAVLHARGTRDVLEAALALCATPDPRRRALGALILGGLGPFEKKTFPEECCDALLDLVRHDRDLHVLAVAVSALGHLRNRRCEPDLIALKNHPDEEIRHGVAFALRGTKEPASVQALLELMEDPNERARDWATTSIGQTVSVDGAEIRAALLRRVNDSDVLTRAEALHGLARRRDERVVPYLIANLPLERDGTYPFYDAAMTFLGVDEDREVDLEELLAALRSRTLPV
jgi:HEAT repeat protein